MALFMGWYYLLCRIYWRNSNEFFGSKFQLSFVHKPIVFWNSLSFRKKVIFETEFVKTLPFIKKISRFKNGFPHRGTLEKNRKRKRQSISKA